MEWSRGRLSGSRGFRRSATSSCHVFFFFQAEDGIRDVAVTGVQTCALPISLEGRLCRRGARALDPLFGLHREPLARRGAAPAPARGRLDRAGGRGLRRARALIARRGASPPIFVGGGLGGPFLSPPLGGRGQSPCSNRRSRRSNAAGPKRFYPRPKVSAASSATWRPIAREAVAAGEGALRTWIASGSATMRKSSTSEPSGLTACARTPAPPRARSAEVSSGTSR